MPVLIPVLKPFTNLGWVLDIIWENILDYVNRNMARFVKQKRWPDWGLNPGPSRHIPDALTTELSGLYQQIN